jgi:hypothetical protein
MKRKFWYQQLPFLLLIACFVLTASAWQGHPQQKIFTNTDTVPDSHKKVRDIDDALEELEKSRTEMEHSLKDVDWQKMQNEIRSSIRDAQINVEKIKAEIAETMKAVEAEKMNASIQKQITKADLEKIRTDIQKSMKDVDAENIQASIEKAIKDVDMQKLKANLDQSIANIDMEKINRQIEKASRVDMQKMQDDLKKIGPEIEKSMKDARLGLEKAKAEMKLYKSFIEDLVHDGLIDKTKDYTIEYKNGDLIINGKKQSAEVERKYNLFLQGRKDFKIKKDSEGFNIND